ncbi:MAG: VCBS repeat-containing protein [Deltaproteobacteria bacterium]|nr:VCBS repeat-containing protein [Deltaproteobacteria bacterium]
MPCRSTKTGAWHRANVIGLSLCATLSLGALGCSSDDDPGVGDANVGSDAHVATDAWVGDASGVDAGRGDSSVDDRGVQDGGLDDTGFSDGGVQDASTTIDASADASLGDSSTDDGSIGGSDSGIGTDAGVDAGSGDGGVVSSCSLAMCEFAPSTTSVAGLTDRATTDIVLLDANLDGDTDLVWVSQWGYSANDPPGGLDLSIGDGRAGFAHSIVDDTRTWLFGVAADVDGDGASDVVVSRAATRSSQVGLYLSDGAGSFVFADAALPSLPACGTDPCSPAPETDNGYVFGRVAVADVDLDGDLDLIVPIALDTNILVGGDASGRPNAVLINDGTGSFTAESGRLPSLTPDRDGTFCIVASDFTGDGAPDIFAGSGLSRPRLLVNVTDQGHYGFFEDQAEDDGFGTPRVPDVTMRTFKCGAVDIDADGDQDVVVVNDVGGSGTTPAYLFTNDGSGYFTATVLPSPEGGPYDNQDTAFGDVNGDGRIDIVISSNAETVTHNGHALEILLQQGDGTFAQVTGLISLPDNIFGVEVADVNGDGLLDIIAAVSKYEETGPGGLANIILLQVP